VIGASVSGFQGCGTRFPGKRFDAIRASLDQESPVKVPADWQEEVDGFRGR